LKIKANRGALNRLVARGKEWEEEEKTKKKSKNLREIETWNRQRKPLENEYHTIADTHHYCHQRNSFLI
jgi:hypothetical protein